MAVAAGDIYLTCLWLPPKPSCPSGRNTNGLKPTAEPNRAVVPTCRRWAYNALYLLPHGQMGSKLWLSRARAGACDFLLQGLPRGLTNGLHRILLAYGFRHLVIPLCSKLACRTIKLGQPHSGAHLEFVWLSSGSDDRIECPGRSRSDFNQSCGPVSLRPAIFVNVSRRFEIAVLGALSIHFVGP